MSSNECYRRAYDVIQSSDVSDPCGTASVGLFNPNTGVEGCCVAGDTCGANGVCKRNTTIDNTSGYYLGGCTDPTYQDPACPRLCNVAGNDVTYQQSSGVWACCELEADGFTPNCDNPSDQYYLEIDWSPDKFPGPINEIFAVSSASSVVATSAPTSSSSVSVISSTPTSDVTPSASAESTSRNGLSAGAKAGVGVGAAVGGLLVLGLLAVVVVLWRRQRSLRICPRAMNQPELMGKPESM